MKKPTKVLFHRDYRGFQGGHLKLYDYINHVDSVDWLQSEVFVDPASREDHLWSNHPHLVESYQPEAANILFIAGTDWRALNAFEGIEEQVPVVNLIQHIRHSQPKHELSTYLPRKALRICVSQEVAVALRQTELCNGPIHTIENGIDLSLLPPPPSDQQGVLIAGLKNPELDKSLCDRLRGHSIEVECLTSHIPRSVYLEKLSKTRIAVTLPNKTEGFYLPALEAMAMGLALVCPDCVGNRSFCRDCVTCLMPEMDLKSLEAASLRLVEDTDLSQRLRTNALAQSRLHSIEMERGLFLNLMRRIVDEPLT